MLTQPQVQRYSVECGLRDLMIAERVGWRIRNNRCVLSRRTERDERGQVPVVLIDGQRLAQEVHNILVTERITLSDLLHREEGWYRDNVRPLPAERVTDPTMHVLGGE